MTLSPKRAIPSDSLPGDRSGAHTGHSSLRPGGRCGAGLGELPTRLRFVHVPHAGDVPGTATPAALSTMTATKPRDLKDDIMSTHDGPHLAPEHDEDGTPIAGTLSTGWDIAFGCRVNYGPGPDGKLRVSVNVSDRAQRDGVATQDTTPHHLRALATHLLAIANEHENERPCQTGPFQWSAFGATYPDTACHNGVCYDLDGAGTFAGIPCPFCDPVGYFSYEFDDDIEPTCAACLTRHTPDTIRFHDGPSLTWTLTCTECASTQPALMRAYDSPTTPPTPSPEQTLATLRALHRPDNTWSCGAQTPTPVDTKHSNGKVSSRETLTCALNANHDGPHVDRISCWNRHEFTDAVPGTPLDRRRCACTLPYAGCETAAALDAANVPVPQNATA